MHTTFEALSLNLKKLGSKCKYENNIETGPYRNETLGRGPSCFIKNVRFLDNFQMTFRKIISLALLILCAKFSTLFALIISFGIIIHVITKIFICGTFK
jgi:hypothetical protein